MVFLVPYDGSPRSRAALSRAVEHGAALGREVVAVSFVPTGDTHAERRRWVDPAEDFAVESATADLERKIEEATDDAERVIDAAGAEPFGSGLTEQVRRAAEDVGATVVFVGVSDGTESESGPEPLTPFGGIAADGPYDIHLVRT